jgi:hypothetical protein
VTLFALGATAPFATRKAHRERLSGAGQGGSRLSRVRGRFELMGDHLCRNEQQGGVVMELKVAEAVHFSK